MKPATIIILFKKYYDNVGKIIIFLRRAIHIHISHCMGAAYRKCISEIGGTINSLGIDSEHVLYADHRCNHSFHTVGRHKQLT